MIAISLLKLIQSQFRFPLTSIHGILHWEHVEAIGSHLAAFVEADLEVITLFAYIHDACRFNEEFDPQHGERSSQLAKDLFKSKFIQISTRQLKDLTVACQFHSQKRVKPENITIATCWDADRLDLWRIGITPNPNYLFSGLAKNVSIQELNQWITSGLRGRPKI